MATPLNLEALLAPVRPDAPCGDDPWANGALSELESLAQGKPETQFAPGEDPDWVQVRTRAIEVAGTTKDLRVGAILAAAVLRTDGLGGFLTALKVVRGYLEAFWVEVYPILDASDNNDPSERINALSNLTAPVGSDGDLLKVIAGLRKVPLLSAPRTGRFGLEHVIAAKDPTMWPADAAAGPPPTAALLAAAVKEVGPEGVAAVTATAQAVAAELAVIEGIFKEKAGPAQFPSFAPLQKEIKAIVGWLEPGGGGGASVGGGPAGATAAVGGAGGGPAAGEGGGASFSGAVRSRGDVLRALDSVISYYKEVEPSSPVPFLVKRAMRIVPMDFVQVMNELTPETREKINLLLGAVDPSSPPV